MRIQKNIKGLTLLSVLLVASMALSSCVIAGQPLTTPVTPESSGEVTPAAGGNLVLYVGPNQVPCTGVAPQTCLQVKETPDGEYTLFYDSIEGFTYEPGYEYVLSVTREDVPNPPADASAFRYTLVEVTSKTAVENATLEGVTWQLAGYLQDGVLQPSHVDANITFKDSEAGGNGGCNQFFAPYALDGDKLTFGLAGSTLIACMEPVMTQEQAVLGNLEKVASYHIAGTQLHLLDEAGQTVLSFNLLVPTPLTGTTWHATGYNNGLGGVVSLIGGTQITAVFGEDGTLSGSGGCNNYSSTYTAKGDTITINPGASTEKACLEPAGLMEQETAYLQALSTAATYTIQGNALDLRTADGALVASFVAETVEMSDQSLAGDGRAAEKTIVGTVWQWAGSFYGDDTSTTVDDPAKYTLTLLADGKTDLQVDCNRGGGNYTLNGSALTLEVAVMTRVACPEGSLSDIFIRDLTNAATFVMDGNDLVINMFADAGNMRFHPGGSVAVTTENLADAGNMTGAQFSTNTAEVAQSSEWQLVPAVPYDDSMAAIVGSPAYWTLTFNGDSPDDASFAGRAVYVAPLADYEAVWSDAGNDLVTQQANALKQLLADQPSEPQKLGVLLPTPFASDITALASYLDLPKLDASGVRWVGRLTQNPGPLVNNELRYLFQGITADGKYLINASFPISTTTLPDTLDALTEDENTAFQEDATGYLEAITSALSFLTPADFTPSLDALDAMLQSITMTMTQVSASQPVTPTQTQPLEGASSGAVAPVTTEALVQLTGQSWQLASWTDAKQVAQKLADTTRYQLTLQDNDTMLFVADCNRGGGSYRVGDGSIVVIVQMMTRAMCPEGSLSNQYVDALNQATQWSLDDGNLTLTTTDGSVLQFAPLQ